MRSSETVFVAYPQKKIPVSRYVIASLECSLEAALKLLRRNALQRWPRAAAGGYVLILPHHGPFTRQLVGQVRIAISPVVVLRLAAVNGGREGEVSGRLAQSRRFVVGSLLLARIETLDQRKWKVLVLWVVDREGFGHPYSSW